MKTIYLFAVLLLTGACIHDNRSSAIVARTTEKTELAATPEIKYFSAKAAVLPEKYYQQFFVNNQTAQTVSGHSGTLLLIPSEAFSDKNGNIVKGKVRLKMAEGITKTDVVKMGLSTMSDHGPLESGGMIHLAAFSETGDTLQLTKNKAIEIEIPTAKNQPGMELWEGAISMEGKLIWKNPKPLSNTLRQIPIEAVEALSVPAPAPAGDTASEMSTISHIVLNGNDTTFWWVFDTVLKTDNSPASEAILKQLRNGNNMAAWRLTNSGFSWNQLADTTAKFWSDKKFENTVIATAEFRARLPYIREACDTKVMTCYTGYPQREIWKSDLAAAEYLSRVNCPLEKVFRHFAETRKGKPDAKDPLTVSILEKARTEALNKYRKNTVAALKKANANNFFPGAYSFRMTTLGWGNIDRLAFGEKTKRMRLNVNVSGLLSGEKIETALISAKQNCYIPGYQRPNGSFAYTHGEYEPESNLPTEGEAYILVKTKTGKDFRYALQKIRFGEREIETVKLVAGTEAELEQQIEKLFGKEDTEYEDWNTSNIRKGTGCVCGQSGVF